MWDYSIRENLREIQAKSVFKAREFIESRSWRVWAVLEGLTKTASALFQKLVGREMGTLEMGAIAAIMIGAIQAASGLLGTLAKSTRNSEHIKALVPDVRSIMWPIAFGAFAGLTGTIWSIYTFTLGADMGIRTLLIMCSIIPGAIIGRVIWNDPLGVRQCLGILTFLVAVWAMFDFPSLAVLVALPSWALATLVLTFTQPINEALSRAASVKLDPWVNNFWVGVSTVFFCTVALMILWAGAEQFTLTLNSKTFVFGTVVIGFFVVGMISFKLLAYKGGGLIALKKIVMQSTYLFGAIFAGVLVWDEPLTNGKLVGPLIAVIAFLLTDDSAWKALFNRRKTLPTV